MPFFTLQLTGQGPILTAFVGVSDARQGALVATGRAIPDLVRIRGLIDTGASGTCIDPSVLKALSLTPTGSVLVNTPSTGATPHAAEQYDVGLLVPGAAQDHAPLVVPNIPVVAAELFQTQGFHALIGRDVLSLCLLSYDGMTGTFTLAY